MLTLVLILGVASFLAASKYGEIIDFTEKHEYRMARTMAWNWFLLDTIVTFIVVFFFASILAMPYATNVRIIALLCYIPTVVAMWNLCDKFQSYTTIRW